MNEIGGPTPGNVKECDKCGAAMDLHGSLWICTDPHCLHTEAAALDAGDTPTAEELVGAVHEARRVMAGPDAGDVEEVAQKVYDNLVAPYAARESALRTENERLREQVLSDEYDDNAAQEQIDRLTDERNALAAQVTTMRGALERLLRACKYTYTTPGGVGTWVCSELCAPSAEEYNAAVTVYKELASPAAERYAALEHFWREYERGTDGDRRGAANTLRALDAKGDNSR